MGLVLGRQHFFAGGGQRYCALEVTTVQMFYSRVYLAHRRVSDPGLDTALSRQRLNRDAFLSAAAIRL